MTDLDPITPTEAREMYVEARRGELADATLEMQQNHLRYFAEWCDDEEIDNLNDLTGRNVHEYRLSRQDRGLARTTIRTQLSTLRVFLKWCQTIEAVPRGLYEKVVPPSLTSEDRRDTMLDSEQAKAILDFLRKFEYASRKHALFRLLWRSGMRMGALRSLDVGDYNSSEQYIELRHRPDSETPLKNGGESERTVALDEQTCVVLDDYIQKKRREVIDDYGREPLFSSRNGRVSKSQFRRQIYSVTRPCVYRSCPHNRDPTDCEAATSGDEAYGCPSSVSPHPVRRGAITHFLLNDVPEAVVSDRMDVSSEVISKHYDRRTEKEQMEQRRGFLDSV